MKKSIKTKSKSGIVTQANRCRGGSREIDRARLLVHATTYESTSNSAKKMGQNAYLILLGFLSFPRLDFNVAAII